MADVENYQADSQDSKIGGHPVDQASAYVQVGKMQIERNNFEEAALLFQKASLIYSNNNLPLNEAHALNKLGACQVMSGQPSDALATLNQAMGCLVDNTDPQLEASIQGNFGLAYGAMQNHQQAFKAHKAVLERSEDLGDDALRLNALINLADCRLQEGNYRSAQGFALVGFDLAKYLHPHPGSMILLNLLGMISSRLGDLRSAADYHQQAYQAALTFDDLQQQAIALANLGLALEGLTEMEKAAQAMERARQIFSDLNSDHIKKTQRDLARIRKSLDA
jgi:tetratricopeptide (TPR) repeat protein